MILLAAVLNLAAVQAAPASAPTESEDSVDEIVVSATFGRTTMLFDKGSDGKLRNCRIMVSSGSQTRDAQACQATPVCFERTADEVTDCTELKADLLSGFVLPTGDNMIAPGSAISGSLLPKLVQPPAPPPPGAVGPRLTTDEPDNSRLRVEKLPPPPSAPTDGPVIRITNAPDQ